MVATARGGHCCTGLFHRLLKLPVTLLRAYDLFDMSSSDQGVMSDLLLVLVDVDSRLDGGASLVDLLATLIFCSSICNISLPPASAAVADMQGIRISGLQCSQSTTASRQHSKHGCLKDQFQCTDMGTEHIHFSSCSNTHSVEAADSHTQ